MLYAAAKLYTSFQIKKFDVLLAVMQIQNHTPPLTAARILPRTYNSVAPS